MISHRNKRTFGQTTVALVIFFTTGAFVLLYTPARTGLTELLYRVVPGMWSAGDVAGDEAAGFWANLRIKRSLVHENETLRAELARLEAQVLDRNLLAEKVARLEESFHRSPSDDRVAANVLSGAGRTPYDTLIIDAGAAQGIAVGNAVVYAGAGVVGEVVEAYERTAKVKLLSFPGTKHETVIGMANIPTTMRGKGMGNFEGVIPRGGLVSLGDEVRTKDGLILGVVGSVVEDPAQPFEKIFARTTFNVATMDSVEVLVGK